MEQDHVNLGQKQEREKRYLYWLFQVPVMGAVTMKRLWDHFGSFEQIYHTEGTQLFKERLLSENDAYCFQKSKGKLSQTTEEYERLEESRIHFVSVLDQEYPERLRHIYGHPMGLYVKGKLPEEYVPSVAVIGARSCSSYGIRTAQMLGEELCQAGVQVISGMALGIDGAGHEGALRGGGHTYAVLGSGPDVCYPQRHWSLYKKIPEHGGILSEFRLHEQALPQHFPMRNRIISGLSDAIVVVQARARSGSLITAELGLEQGKEIFAVPGMIMDPLSQGCNRLIRQGADVVTATQDILEFFQIIRHRKLRLHEKMEDGLAKNQKMVYSCLDFQPKYFDQVVKDSGLPAQECIGVLLELEWKGMIRQPTDHYYVKT